MNNPPTFNPTLDEQIAVSLSYVAYSGSDIPRHLFLNPDRRILDLINTTIPHISVLCSEQGQFDWEVVWGPAIYTFDNGIFQDNAMFVARRISRPSEYVIAIRGTNSTSILDWIEEDLNVFTKVDWEVPDGVKVEGEPKISQATQVGLDALLNKLTPAAGLPGKNQNLTSFLTGLIATAPVDLRFVGHSLGGALAPTLALWFRQSQGLPDHWDPSAKASISAISFAGPTAGDDDFAALSDRLLSNRCDRIHYTLDIVPHGWDRDTLATVPDLYKAGGIVMIDAEKLLFDGLMLTLNHYQQIERSRAVTWTIQKEENYQGFFKQAAVQHFDAYPDLLGVPELTTLIQKL